MSTADTEAATSYEPPPPPVHPLSSLSISEVEAVARLARAFPDFGDTTRFSYVGLDEPSKDAVLAWEAGDGPLPGRHVRVWLHDTDTGHSTDSVVALNSGSVVRHSVVDGATGSLPTLDVEAMSGMAALSADERWVTALARRDLEPAQVRIMPLSAGHYGYPQDEGRRLVRCLAFAIDYPTDSMWAHPVDGLSAYVDLRDGSVQEVIDTEVFPVPRESGDIHDPEVMGAPMTGLRPIAITQPEGPSFTVDGEHITWGNWTLRIGFDMREGLILRQLAFADQDVSRPIMYRGSISEMVVPYGDPHPNRFWQNYFDTGEFLFGRFANSLTLGCDCVGEIFYFDATFSDENGDPRTVTNGICMHEEDYGALWKHTDIFTGAHAVRRSRRLVISSFSTLGNYDYGFFWYLYLDGTIECEVKLTGVVFTSAYPGADEDGGAYAYASEVAPGLGAPYHQHLFSARLDMTVDGLANVVNEVDAVRLPISPSNPAGNAFTKSVRPITRESESGRLADGSKGRVWQIASTERTTRLGQPTSYVLHPTDAPTLLADPGSSIAARAHFATKHLWVTRYDEAERYPSGDFVNMNPGDDGMQDFVADDQDLVGQDLVLWHTFGVTHFPRNEDWPVMPVGYAKFGLAPYNFFERNPTLTVPAPDASGHCHAD